MGQKKKKRGVCAACNMYQYIYGRGWGWGVGGAEQRDSIRFDSIRCVSAASHINLTLNEGLSYLSNSHKNDNDNTHTQASFHLIPDDVAHNRQNR